MSTAEYLQYELRTAARCEVHYAELVAFQGRHDFVGQVLTAHMDPGGMLILAPHAFTLCLPFGPLGLTLASSTT